MISLLIFGLGYSGRAIAELGLAQGWAVAVTSRTPRPEPGFSVVPFGDAHAAIAAATHVVATAAPDEGGDPVLARYGDALRAAPMLRYAGYLSTTGVYGNRDGGWVDEDTPPAPTSPRAQRRVVAEAAWAALPCAVDIFRLAGIYGPGRSMFDDLREGTARRVVKTDHLFGRIHRDDIAAAVIAAILTDPPPGRRIFNGSDDEPAASADVVVEAARLLGPHVADGAELLVGKPESRQRENQGGAEPGLALPDLPRRPSRHPGRGDRRRPHLALPVPPGGRAGARRP
jgi:nucleoside-diphosphate-sugar epimerase